MEPSNPIFIDGKSSMENSHENIYSSLGKIQCELQGIELKKSGWNQFGNFKYYELDDILPTIQQLCFKHHVLLDFTFTKEEGILEIRKWEKPQEVFQSRIPLPPLKEMNKKMNIVQSLGSYVTYIKRYLLMNTFLISEKSVVDSTSNSQIEMEERQQQRKKESKQRKKEMEPRKQTNSRSVNHHELIRNKMEGK